MSPTAQRIALAELAKWAKCPFDGVSYYVPIQGKVAVACDPLNDLNAVHEVILSTIKTWVLKVRFVAHLDSLAPDAYLFSGEGIDEVAAGAFPLITAKPEVLCAAILRTLNLWDDSK